MLRVVFSALYSVFGNVFTHGPPCLIYYIIGDSPDQKTSWGPIIKVASLSPLSSRSFRTLIEFMTMYLPAHDLTEPIQNFIKMGPSIRVIIPALRHKGLELRLTSVLLDHGPEWRFFMCHHTSNDFCKTS